jgi:hypothetical protein
MGHAFVVCADDVNLLNINAGKRNTKPLLDVSEEAGLEVGRKN